MKADSSILVKESISEFVNEILSDSDEKSKIAILVSVFSKFDGAGRVAEYQAKELSENGYEVTVFSFEADILLSGVKFDVLKVPQKLIINRIYRTLFPLDIRGVKWASKLKNFDLIIAHQYPITYLACLAKKLYKVRYCFFNHGQPPYEIISSVFSQNKFEENYHKIVNKLGDLTIKNADYTISTSRFSRKSLKSRVGIDSVVIHNKVSETFEKGLDSGKIRDKYGIADKPLILFVGRIVPSKGVHLLIRAFEIVKQEILDAKLMIVGNPYFKGYFEKLKVTSNNSVIFAGYVSDEDLPYYYAACDVYATCSLWEGFNLPLAEAQACGKPVVAFNIGPHPEIIDENGILIDEGDIEGFAKACIYKIKQVGGLK